MTDRPTVRPVTLARLVEVTNHCEEDRQTTEEISDGLDVSHRRGRETILEALRLDILDEAEGAVTEDATYGATPTGVRFLDAVKEEDWSEVNEVLTRASPHYRAFLQALDEVAPASLQSVLEHLKDHEEDTDRSYNQTSVEVLGDWAERLGRIQRNAFTGTYYPVGKAEVPPDFPDRLLDAYDHLEETAGVSLRQRYLSIPELREHLCERMTCPRDVFDKGLGDLARQNVGKLELSGAPVDTGAKEASLGIKEIAKGAENGLVTTNQSTEKVMAGVEQFGKQYYYLAVHDRDLTFTYE